MGLAEDIQSAVSSGMKSLGTIRKQVTYHSTGTITYNTTTGQSVESGDTDIENLDVTFTSYKLEEIDGNIIHKEDKKALIPKLDLSVVPKETDYILHGSVRWDVQSKKIDPAEALWILQVRKHSGS